MRPVEERRDEAYAQPTPRLLYVHDDLSDEVGRRFGPESPAVGLTRSLFQVLGRDRDRVIVLTLAEQVDRRETGLAQRAGEFEARSREREAQLAEAEKQARDRHFRRSLQVYQGMDPELVAADLQKKWGGGPEEKREVVSVLRSLPSRVSAEVMNAIADSATRVEIMKEVKGS